MTIPRLNRLACNGTSRETCDKELFRFIHPTCLWCRTRRRSYRGYVNPPFFWQYIYKSSIRENNNNQISFQGVLIDPRGNPVMVQFRVSCIRVFDVLTGLFRLWNHTVKFPLGVRVGDMGMPLTEVCEFLANYPVW